MVEAVPLKKSKSNDSTIARVSVLENQVATISQNIEKLDMKVEAQYQTLHSRISDLRDDLKDDFDTRQEKIVEKLDAHSVASAATMDEIKTKINDLEKWRWMVMGAAVVVGFILAHVNLGNIF
jgi:uncharacterized coiled-coil protein SlyX